MKLPKINLFAFSLDSILSSLTRKAAQLEKHSEIAMAKSRAASDAAVAKADKSLALALESDKATRVAAKVRSLIA